ncbi:MAG: tetratricopeptide repeat protein [Mariniblastus sp.]
MKHLVNYISRTIFLLALAALTAWASNGWAQDAASIKDAVPTKEALIKDLKAIVPLLEKKNFVAAAAFVNTPEGFKPEMLNGLIDRKELSMDGVLRLERDAKFGKATEVFGQERAKALIERHRIDVDQCYGFNHEVDGSFGEIIAFWNGSRFKLTRMDDVGKFPPLNGTMKKSGGTDSAEKAPGASTTNDSRPKTEEEIAAAEQARLVELSQMAVKLSAVIEAEPKNVAVRAQYAMVLLKIKNVPGAWKEIRTAAKIDSKHPGLAERITAVIMGLEQMGAFTVGVPEETIEGLLGEPDQKVDLGSGNSRWVYNFFGVDFKAGRLHTTIDIRGATQALFQPTEIVSIDLDGRGWRCGARSKRKNRVVARYFIPGESIASWNEQVQVERLPGVAKKADLDLLVKMMCDDVESKPGVKSKILESTENYAIIAFDYPKTALEKKRFELVKVMSGPVDLHRVYYKKRTEVLTQETQVQWLAIMKAAKLEKVKMPASR